MPLNLISSTQRSIRACFIYSQDCPISGYLEYHAPDFILQFDLVISLITVAAQFGVFEGDSDSKQRV